MNIPMRLPNSAFEVAERPRTVPYVPVEPAVNKLPPSILAVGGLELDRQSGPAGRDVSFEIERLFARLTPPRPGERRSSDLGIDFGAPGASSRLQSFGELNSAGTSFERTRLSFGSSTSAATLSGTYAGTGAATGATALRIEVTQAASLGSNPSALRFTVSDQNGAALYSFDGVARAGEAISLGADVGLSIAFSAGGLLPGSRASTAVSSSVPTQVDPDAVFADTNPERRPRFEDGAQVVAGSFKLNGQTIEVRADDSISSVLARMSENVPGLVANFADDRVRLSFRAQSRQPIVLSEDTSGFLAATKLTGAVGRPGAAPGGDELLALSPQFARVNSGSFRVGGRWVSVDPTRDSLESVMARMREAAPGLLAYVEVDREAGDGRLVVRAAEEDRVMLGDDTSGFLEAVGLPPGPVSPEREPMQLEAGIAHRLEQAAHSERAGLVDRVLSALALPTGEIQPVTAPWAEERRPEEAAAASRPTADSQPPLKAETARKARTAYARDSSVRATSLSSGSPTSSGAGPSAAAAG